MALPLSTVKYLRSRVKDRGQGYVFTKEKYIKPYLPKLKRMFEIFDEDGSGEIDLLELEAALYDYKGIPQKEIVRLLSVFKELDGVKDDGQISFDEFVSVMKTSKSFADPRSFYFLTDEQGSEDQEINEKFAAFANLYERAKNQRKVDIEDRDFKSYKAFHLLFSGTYNLPTANLLAGESETQNREENEGRKIMRRRSRRVRMNESGANDVEKGFKPLSKTQFSGGIYKTRFAKQDVFLKSKANHIAGSIIRQSNTKLPVIPQKFISPLKKLKKMPRQKFSSKKANSYLSSAASSIYSESSYGGSFAASGPGSRQFSRGLSSKYYASTRGSNRTINFKMNSSTNLHRRTKAVIGKKIEYFKPPFPISTW